MPNKPLLDSEVCHRGRKSRTEKPWAEAFWRRGNQTTLSMGQGTGAIRRWSVGREKNAWKHSFKGKERGQYSLGVIVLPRSHLLFWAGDHLKMHVTFGSLPPDSNNEKKTLCVKNRSAENTPCLILHTLIGIADTTSVIAYILMP